MKTLFLDCFSGISGDMILGTLIDLGVDEKRLTGELEKLHVGGYSITFSKKITSGIVGTDVDVKLIEARPCSNHHQGDHDHCQIHHHDHSGSRNLADCVSIIEKSGLSDEVKTHAIRVFEEVAMAEAHVHGKPVDQVHFHEIGAIDSIVDIVGTFIGLELLGVEKIYASPLHDGNGSITCAHGIMPVPVPAVAQMLASSERPIPYVQEDIPTELITPTGMAIIKTIASGFGKIPQMDVQAIGYGTGKRETGRMNALRGMLGESMDEPASDQAILLEANIDNQNGEQLGYTMNRLLSEGALDVFFTPIYMKKSRPATMLSVLSKPESKQKMIHIILAETTTLGIRTFECPRSTMNREFLTVRTKFGPVQVKHAFLDDIEKYSPEFDDCARLAISHKVPLAKVCEAAQKSILDRDWEQKSGSVITE